MGYDMCVWTDRLRTPAMLLLRTTLLSTLLIYVGLLAVIRAGAWLPPEQIAYDARKSRENYDLHLLDVRWRIDIPLTRTPYGERAPAWSPDGSQLAFASDVDGRWEIYVRSMTDLSAPPTQITADFARAMHPAWSPDGTQIAYDSSKDGNLELYLLDVSERPGAQTVSPTRQQRLTNIVGTDEQPAWSPDGERLAFASYRDGDLDVYMMDLATRETRNLTENIADTEWGAAWSPDGEILTFTSSRETFWQIYAVDPLAPEAVTPLTAFSRDVAEARWSPDGAWLTLERYDRTGTRSLYLLPTDAARQNERALRRLTLGPTDDRGAAWRPR